MNIYDKIDELLQPIETTLDIMKKFIQPTIFEGLKSNIESIKYLTKKQEERAKKVEELLQAYRELIDKTSAWELDWDLDAKVYILEEEINLKENELEELK